MWDKDENYIEFRLPLSHLAIEQVQYRHFLVNLPGKI